MNIDNTRLPWCLLSDISRSYIKRCILLLWKPSQGNDPYMFVSLVSCVFGDWCRLLNVSSQKDVASYGDNCCSSSP